MTKPLTQHETRLLAALDKSAVRARDEQNRITGLVGQLRAQDVPWETIARTLGITKQGAQQRFSA